MQTSAVVKAAAGGLSVAALFSAVAVHLNRSSNLITRAVSSSYWPWQTPTDMTQPVIVKPTKQHTASVCSTISCYLYLIIILLI